MNRFSENNKFVNQKKINRSQRRSKLFRDLKSAGVDAEIRLSEIYDYFATKLKLGKGTMVKVVDYILAMNYNGLHCHPTTQYLGDRFGVDAKTICRITSELQDLGFIKKRRIGFNCPIHYMLTGILNNAVVQYYLQDLFPTLRYIGHNFFATTGRYMKDFLGLFSSFIPTDVTLLDNRLNIINNLNDKNSKNNSSNRENDSLSSSQQSFSYKKTNFYSSSPDFQRP